MKKFYWKCELCKIVNLSTSLQTSKQELEEHEKQNHKSKLVGSFGFQIIPLSWSDFLSIYEEVQHGNSNNEKR